MHELMVDIHVLPFAFPSSTRVPMWTGKQLAWKGSLTITLKYQDSCIKWSYIFYWHKNKPLLTLSRGIQDILLQQLNFFIAWTPNDLPILQFKRRISIASNVCYVGFLSYPSRSVPIISNIKYKMTTKINSCQLSSAKHK